MKNFEGYKYIEGGVCAAKGFKASGVYCGIKKPADGEGNPLANKKNDIALIVSDVMCNAAAVYTQNKVKGAPILVTKKNLAKTSREYKKYRKRTTKIQRNSRGYSLY